jgi:hypothetical protein
MITCRTVHRCAQLLAVIGVTLGSSLGQTVKLEKRSLTEQANEKQVSGASAFRRGHPTRHWIIFAANSALSQSTGEPETSHLSPLGHIFVIFGIEDPLTNSSRMEAFGFYPSDKSLKTALNSTLEYVPGSIEDNLDGIHEGSWKPGETQMLVVAVPSLDYERARNEVGIHQAAAIPSSDSEFMQYNIPNSDCVSFVDWVAGAIGLNRPLAAGLTALPMNYLNALSRLNIDGPSDPRDYSLTTPPKILYTNRLPPTQVQYQGQTNLLGLPSGRGSVSYQDGSTLSGNMRYGIPTGPVGVPGSFCTSEDETNWNKRSSIWHEGRSIQQSRS